MRLLKQTITFLMFLSVPTTAAAQWAVEVLGAFEGRPTVAAAVNDDGVVVGNGWNAEGEETPLLWTPEGGYEQFLGDVAGRAHDINNRGEVVGLLFNPTGSQAFLWSRASGLMDLGMGFYPTKINDAGVVVGSCEDPTSMPCVWRNGTRTLLDSPFPGIALAVNNEGDVTGYIADPFAPTERELPVVWRRGGAIQMLPTPPGGHYAVPYAINSQGLIVGFTYIPFDQPRLEVVMWDSEGAFAPGLEGTDGVGLAVNDAGVVVGISPGLSHPARGFTWTAGGDIIFLPGGDASRPTDINARGDIVGGVLIGDASYAAVWRQQAPLRITTPNSRSQWGLNTRRRLAWTYDGDAPQFQIDISRDGGDTWDFLSVVPNRVGGSQNFFLTVTGPATPSARLRVTAIGDEEATDVNDADIRIAPATIDILLPSGRAAVTFGSTQDIFFRHNLGARKPVAIDVSGDGGATWRTVANGTRTTGSTTASFGWFVDVMPTTRGRVRVRALDGSSASSVSAFFSVVAREQPFQVTGGSVAIGCCVEADMEFTIHSQEVSVGGEAHGDSPGGLIVRGPRCPVPCPIVSGSRGSLSSEITFRGHESFDVIVAGQFSFSTPPTVFSCGPPDGFCDASAPFTLTAVVSRYDESGRLLTSYAFVGGGTARGVFQTPGNRDRLTYTFTAAQEPTSRWR